MPNRNAHQVLGAFAGGGAAFIRARNQQPIHALVETLGGAFAGYHFGHWADRIGTPTSPHHRSAAHGLVPVAAANVASFNALDAAQEWLREQADNPARRSAEAGRSLMGFIHFLLEMIYRFASGALAGILGSYDSHLLADSTTKAGLPLIA